jgi:NAD(P)-dependent dehydrogenase (short-subunit alcohol dehydrogenase family)
MNDWQNPGSIKTSKMRIMQVMQCYGVAKMANAMFAVELQRRFDAEQIPILSLSVNPGMSSTAATCDLWPWFMSPIIRLFAQTPEKGAWNSLFAATALVVREEDNYYKGQYLGSNGRPAPAHPAVRNSAMTRTLWEVTEGIVEDYMRKADR